jgi:hypothetical protein
MTILRTARNGCFALKNGHFGAYIKRVDDPLADATLTEADFKTFEIKPDFNRIPADLWARWIDLCLHFVDKAQQDLEVSVRLLVHEDDFSQWRFLVPFQEVTSGSVRADTFDLAMDIATGEVIEQYPPAGWIPVGSSHSHNTMTAFFSPTDDKFELGDPGLHIVVGSLNAEKRTYWLKASITADKRRFIVEHDSVIDTTPTEVKFHPDVLTYITVEPPTSAYYDRYNDQREEHRQWWHSKTSNNMRRWDANQQRWIAKEEDDKSKITVITGNSNRKRQRPINFNYRSLGSASISELADALEEALWDSFEHVSANFILDELEDLLASIEALREQAELQQALAERQQDPLLPADDLNTDEDPELQALTDHLPTVPLLAPAAT